MVVGSLVVVTAAGSAEVAGGPPFVVAVDAAVGVAGVGSLAVAESAAAVVGMAVVVRPTVEAAGVADVGSPTEDDSSAAVAGAGGVGAAGSPVVEVAVGRRAWQGRCFAIRP